MTQNREGEMKAKNQGFVSRSPVHEATPGGHGLFAIDVESRIPSGLIQMNRMKRFIGDAEQLLAHSPQASIGEVRQ